MHAAHTCPQATRNGRDHLFQVGVEKIRLELLRIGIENTTQLIHELVGLSAIPSRDRSVRGSLWVATWPAILIWREGKKSEALVQ